MITLYRTTLVDRDGSHVGDAVTPRSAAYDRLRKATTGRWFAVDPDLGRYSSYRAVVIAERRLRGSPAAVAAHANRAVIDALTNALRSPRSASAHLDQAAAAAATVAATGFWTPWSTDTMRRLVTDAHEGMLGLATARARIVRIGRRSGSLVRWYHPVSGVDVLDLSDPVAERTALIIDDLRTAGCGWLAVARAHGLPATVVGRLVRAAGPVTTGWRHRMWDGLWPEVANCTPNDPVSPPLYALRLRVVIPEHLAAASLAAHQPAELRALAPRADWGREYLLPPMVAAQAQVLAAERLELPIEWSGYRDVLAAGVAEPGSPGFAPFQGWRHAGTG
jgi:hypothetical protein